jgi:hypothetical protein
VVLTTASTAHWPGNNCGADDTTDSSRDHEQS